jgi:hypothetical protein
VGGLNVSPKSVDIKTPPVELGAITYSILFPLSK